MAGDATSAGQLRYLISRRVREVEEDEPNEAVLIISAALLILVAIGWRSWGLRRFAKTTRLTAGSLADGRWAIGPPMPTCQK